jgi:membrane-associated protease RseP (regulator of RpoE activity)
MKARFSTSLASIIAAIILAAASALAQPAAPAPPTPPEDLVDQSFSFFVEGDGFLGVYAENISRENMSRYHVEQVRGVGVTQVVKDSPAEKAGLRKDDVILRIDGENITSVRKLNRIVSELSPDQSVRVTVSRGGAEQELTATIGKRNHPGFAGGAMSPNNYFKLFRERPQARSWKFEGPFPGGSDFFDKNGDLTFALGASRRIGVSTMQLSKQLADYFGITSGKGVLVTSVTDDGPAAKAGVRAGDVITAIDGEEVDSPGDISRAINRKKDGDVSLTIIRNKTQQTIRVTPREGGGFSGTLGQPEIGRQIVIPRIEIPMPEIDIAMPRIVVPSVPSINIEMPRVRVKPRARIRTVQGPI